MVTNSKKITKKYKMNFYQFEQLLGKKFNLTWENEKDYIDWDWTLANSEKIKKIFHFIMRIEQFIKRFFASTEFPWIEKLNVKKMKNELNRT